MPEDTSKSYCQRLAAVFLTSDKAAVPKQHRKQIEALLPSDIDKQSFWTSPAAANTPENRDVFTNKLTSQPQLQSWMAAFTAYTPNKWLLERELANRQSNASLEGMEGWRASFTEDRDSDVYFQAAGEALTGLCFSGGGIRSATFNLGILQALASRGLLPHFDYLSSVSGGGYIHQWFAAWVLRSQDALTGVQKKLIPQPSDGCPPRSPEPIFWLRRYSSYLTPQRGVFSADTWTTIAIWFRNTLLNQIVLFSFIGLILFFFHLFLPDFSTTNLHEVKVPGPLGHADPRPAQVSLAIVCAASAALLGWQIFSNFRSQRDLGKRKFLLTNNDVVLRIVLPGLVVALATTFLFASKVNPGFIATAAAVFFSVINLLITFSSGPPQRGDLSANSPLAFWLVVSSVVTGCIASLLINYATHLVFVIVALLPILGQHASEFTIQLVFYPPLLYAAPFLAINLQLGILGRDYLESRREWIARLRAWTILVAMAWLILSAISLLGPNVVHYLLRSFLHTKTSWTAVLIFLGSHIAALYSGASSKSDGTPSDKGLFGYSVLDLVGIVAAPCAILSLLMLFSYVLQKAIQHTPPFFLSHLPAIVAHAWIAFVLIIFLLTFGMRVDINDFSMHGFYRNRLSRCYLGASLDSRSPDPFTGFDERSELLIGSTTAQDDPTAHIRVIDLLPHRFQKPATTVPVVPHPEPPLAGPPTPPHYTGPFPIFSCTLNLTFGEDLAWQERKGASFAFTPLYSGYHVGWTAARDQGSDQAFNGFVPTGDFAYPGGVHLATAAAISGAAMSPNQGFSTQASLAFLMTVFNVRLGWWIANPRRPDTWPSEKDRPTPRAPLVHLLSELAGAADDANRYVYLNDGGKFDNMGLYELVRRRCRFIVICDAEEDGDLTFEGIAMAIRKCRTDFGAEITLNLRPICKEEGSSISERHFAVGTIQYPPPPGHNPAVDAGLYKGIVIYIKSSLTGDEPADVLSYSKKHAAFPHDMTANQWFTESQFESYRRLGDHILTGVFPDRPAPGNRAQVEQLFQAILQAQKD